MAPGVGKARLVGICVFVFFLVMRGAGDEGDMKGTGWGGSERECKVVVGWDVEQDTRRGR